MSDEDPALSWDVRVVRDALEMQSMVPWPSLDRIIRAAEDRATAWNEGYVASARFRETPMGHWEQDSPREGMRTWVADRPPANPYLAHN